MIRRVVQQIVPLISHLLMLFVSTIPAEAFVVVDSLRSMPTNAFPSTTTNQFSRSRSRYIPSSSQLYSIPDPIDTLTSGLASLVRLPNGVTVRPNANLEDVSTPRLQRLYDVENSRACRKVRELITELDLVVEAVIPATANSRCFTDSTYEYAVTADTMIPRLVLNDAGNDMVLQGEDEILNYFHNKYALGKGTEIVDLLIALVNELRGNLAGLLRAGRGNLVSPAALGPTAPHPQKPLVLYSYEGNQFCRLVREVLTELDIVYELRSVGKGSPRRQELAATSGATQCPFLLDPNRDTALPESADIVAYLYKNYARYTPPSELLQWTSDYVMKLAEPIFQREAPWQAGLTNKAEGTGIYNEELQLARDEIQRAVQADTVVVYTYELSPFSSETLRLLQNFEIEYKEISLGKEWIPGLINKGGAKKRAALLDMTGQSSLPHIFIGGESIGGLYSGTPGLLALAEQGALPQKVQDAIEKQKTAAEKVATLTSRVLNRKQ